MSCSTVVIGKSTESRMLRMKFSAGTEMDTSKESHRYVKGQWRHEVRISDIVLLDFEAEMHEMEGLETMVEQLSVGTVKAAVTEISRQTMDDVQMLKARLHALNTRVGLDRRDSSELLWSAVFAQSSVYELKRPVIGIDLGSTNSSVSIMEGKTSCVISKAWRRQAVVNSANTVFVFKRLIGRQFDDKEVKDDRKHCRSRISMVFGKIAEQYLNKKVKDAQWQSTKDASQIAGLDVFRVINEPMAAAFAYGLDKNSKAKMVAVYDLMISAEMHDGVYEVKSTNGDTHLGGEDFDILLVDHLVKQFKAENSINLNGDRMAIQRIREAAKKAKIELSSTVQTGKSLRFSQLLWTVRPPSKPKSSRESFVDYDGDIDQFFLMVS
ncbi:Hsp70 protein-domain-containing protein [Mycena pura]|uniref:Hsp70 protein-domain-containing protein n=1 Tax=Mycena pura TaxID=153505 RepID=A0AAD6UN28_9AGAR|nr:Hsp70 protein-domain-containing protein [Mycena pura]